MKQTKCLLLGCLASLIVLFSVSRAEGGDVDIDLTAMNSTMVYATVFNIVNNPLQYAGQTMKLTGEYTVYPTDDPAGTIHACLVRDAAGCCASGLEFRLAASQEYPPEGSEITLIGTLALDPSEKQPIPLLENASFIH